MNNLTQIIHKLEEERQKIAGRVIADNEDMNDPEFYDVKDYIYTRIESELPQYDLYQSIITILEKIDEGKIEKEVINIVGNECCEANYDNCGYDSMTLAQFLTNWLRGDNGYK